MSNETIKLEADCAVATYNHLHHHHHHPHQNPHLQHHHNPIAHHDPIIHDHHENGIHLKASHEDDDRGVPNDEEEEEEEDNLIEADEEQENKEQTNELLQLESTFNRGQIEHSSIYDINKLSNSATNEQVNLVSQTNGDKFTQLENVNPINEQQLTIQKDVIRLHQHRHLQPTSSSPSSSVDSSETSDDDELDSDEEDEEEEEEEEADDEYADDDEEEDEDCDEEVDDEEEDDDDEDEEDEDSDAIVDPVGHHQYLNPSGAISSNSSSIANDTNQTAISNLSSSVNDDDYDDVLFANDYDESSAPHNSSTSDLLYSERMLEVTRKLVRSTERDPDRDLRKQVLLRTAIRKLPHFMEYNHYSETFDRNFRLHNNTINDNNNTTVLECLSPPQYYEHHSIHHLEQQPKSYYHSVQPNAIQMSTTSLRMLDLNDDTDAEFAMTNPIETKHHHMSYESTEHVAQIGLDQQHDYANSNLYNPYSQHNSQMNQIQDQTLSLQSEPQTVMHDFNQYSNTDQQPRESSANLISRHDNLDNLYQPLETESIVESSDSSVEPAAFQSVQDYSRVCTEQENYDRVDAVVSVSDQEVESNDNLEELQTVSDSRTEHLGESTINISPDDDHAQDQQRNDCDLEETKTTACHGGNDESTKEIDTHDCNTVSLSQNGFLDGNDSGLNEDKIDGSEGGSSSSQSSTSSEDSANLSSSHSNDSTGDSNGLSLLETSLNSANEYQHCSHDSGVALFSPKTNKRTSSSIGLDEEMEIDHLTEITPSDQVNTGTVANHYKKLRKRELVE